MQIFESLGIKRDTSPLIDATSPITPDGQTAASTVLPIADGELTPTDLSDVLGVTRNIDAWFEREVTTIRKEAERLGTEWAAGNLPAMNDVQVVTLDPETMLARSCESLWQAWPERARVHTQGAIDASASELVRNVANARAAITEARNAGDELKDAESSIDLIRRNSDAGRRAVKYGPLLGNWPFWLLAVALVLVEFLANHPVFRIIFPLSARQELTMNDLIASQLGAGGMESGFKSLFLDILSYTEATILAGIIVIALVVSAKTAGAALRARTALKPADYSFAAVSINSLHRQMKISLAVVITILICLLYFLFSARQGAPARVNERLTLAKAGVDSAQVDLDRVNAAGTKREGEVGIKEQILSEARAEVQRMNDQLAFAKTIDGNNFGMALLNIALVGVGVLIGFLNDTRDLTETIGEDSDIVRLKQKCLTAREQIRRLTEQARTHALSADVAAARTFSLLNANPLRTLDAKRATLNSIIPMWREVNARLRRIDPSNIVAFQQPFLPTLTDISDSVELRKPETFERALSELDQLRLEINQVERFADEPIALAA